MKYMMLKCAYPVAFVLLTFGIVLIAIKTSIVKYFITQNIQLKPGSFLYKSWVNTSADIYTEFYLFNLVNGKEFETHGSKPIFQEIGPFVYKEIRTKEKITNNCNGTITYKERRRFFFVPERSPYPENYNITSINMAAMVVINYVKYWTKIELEIINLAFKLSGETLLVTQPAHKLLFGYEDPFLKMLLKLDKNLFPSAMIGLYYNKNNTIDGEYTVFDGVVDSRQIGVIEYFNGQDKLSIWSDKYANQINGTDGSLNFPFMKKTTQPVTFQSDACRSIHLVFNETRQINYQIDLYGYIIDENLLANTSVNPSNAGFCTPPGNCLVSGLLNLTSCVQIGPADIPAYMSLPHFLFGDKKLTNEVIGLKPNLSEHRTVVYFQPLTGIPMKANKRIQLNTKILRNKDINLTLKLPEIYFPLFWIDENFEIDNQSAKLFSQKVQMPLEDYDFLKYLMLAIGSFLFTISICYTLMIACCNKDMYEELSTETVDNSSLTEPGTSTSQVDEITPLVNE